MSSSLPQSRQRQRVREPTATSAINVGLTLAQLAAEASQTPGGAPYEGRLLSLFVEIEREFAALYDENRELRRRLLEESHTDTATSAAPSTAAAPSAPTTAVSASAIPPPLPARLVSDEVHMKVEGASGGQVRLSNKARANKHLYRSEWHKHRDYVGHRDGVYEVTLCGSTNSMSKHGVLGTGSADRTARLWSLHSSQFLYNYTGHKGAVNSIRFHPSEPIVCTASGDKTCHIWKIPQVTLKILEQLGDHNPSSQLGTSHTTDGTESLDSRVNGDVSEVTSLSGKTPLVRLVGHNDVVSAVDWLPDGKRLVSASYDNSVAIWEINETNAVRIQSWNSHEQRVLYVTAHSTEPLALSCSKDQTFRLWDFRKPSVQISSVHGHQSPVTSAAFTKVGSYIVSSSDRAIKVWDLKYLKAPVTSVRLPCMVNRLSVSPTVSTIAVPLETGDIMLMDLSGGLVAKIPRSLKGHSKSVSCTAWGPNESRLISAGWPEDVMSWSPTKQL